MPREAERPTAGAAWLIVRGRSPTVRTLSIQLLENEHDPSAPNARTDSRGAG